MKRSGTLLGALALMLVAGVSASATPPTEAIDARPADTILEEYRAVAMPRYDGKKAAEDPNYRETYMAERAAAEKKQGDLILELFTAYPQHEALVEMLPRRWMRANPQQVLQEADRVLLVSNEGPLHMHALYHRANALVRARNLSDTDARTEVADAINAFIKADPEDGRGARLLSGYARALPFGHETQIAAYERIKAEYPGRSAKYVDGKLRQIRELNKPFKLEFEDAITGQRVTMADLRGQVVVIDFWATWCGPCVREMPHLKELYERYHRDGVEFIGISLDQPVERGGLDKLKQFAKDKEIPWLQYYQGNGWDSKFSAEWGINSIPSMFIIDKQGNLHSVQARGKLETLIPELLAK